MLYSGPVRVRLSRAAVHAAVWLKWPIMPSSVIFSSFFRVSFLLRRTMPSLRMRANIGPCSGGLYRANLRFLFHTSAPFCRKAVGRGRLPSVVHGEKRVYGLPCGSGRRPAGGVAVKDASCGKREAVWRFFDRLFYLYGHGIFHQTGECHECRVRCEEAFL